jgi:hypothetical protein
MLISPVSKLARSRGARQRSRSFEERVLLWTCISRFSACPNVRTIDLDLMRQRFRPTKLRVTKITS